MAANSTRVVIVAFVINLVITIAKFIAWFFTGSTSMLAEGFHSIADTGNQIFLYLGLKKAEKPADKKHPFGYGNEEYFWAFLVALLIFLVGAIFAIYEGIHKLMHPEAIENGYVNVILLAVAVLLEAYSAFVATTEFKKAKGAMPFFKYVRTSKNQILITVLFEDYAALVGLMIALVGNVVSLLTQNPIYDSISSIVIGVLLACIAGFLYFEAKSLLLGEAASEEDLVKIEAVFNRHPDVVRANEILTLHFGSNQMLINAHVRFKEGISVEQVEIIIDQIEVEIAKEIPSAFKIFIETHQKDKVGKIRKD